MGGVKLGGGSIRDFTVFCQSVTNLDHQSFSANGTSKFTIIRVFAVKHKLLRLGNYDDIP